MVTEQDNISLTLCQLKRVTPYAEAVLRLVLILSNLWKAFVSSLHNMPPHRLKSPFLKGGF